MITKAEMKLKRIEQRKDIELPPVSIVCNTCIGGRLYHDYQAKFLSPFIDMYILPEEFVKLCKDLKGYLAEELIIKPQSNEEKPLPTQKNFLPMLLGDITIWFTHSNKDYDISKYKFEERKERIVYDNIKVICTDRVTICKPLQNCGSELIRDFANVPYENKVFFTTLPIKGESYVEYLPSFKDSVCCPEATRPSPLCDDKYILETDGFDLDAFLMK